VTTPAHKHKVKLSGSAARIPSRVPARRTISRYSSEKRVYEHKRNDETDCRDVTKFQGQDCRCPLFAHRARCFRRVLRSRPACCTRDPAATAANILAHQLLFRLGFAAQIVAQTLNIFLAVIFFDLFRVVNRSFARLVVFSMLTGTAIETVALLNRFAPLIILHGGNYLSAFNTEQLQGAAYASLQLYEFGFTTALVFFGFYCLSLGYLVFTSAFLPRIIGVLLAIGGLAYLTGNFGNFLSPAFAARLFPYYLVFPGLGEGSLILWLLIMGVNAQGWR